MPSYHCLFISARTFRMYVYFDLPLLRLPCKFNSQSCLVMLFFCILGVWPIHHLLRIFNSSSIGDWLVLIDLSLISPRPSNIRMRLRQWNNRIIICIIVASTSVDEYSTSYCRTGSVRTFINVSLCNPVNGVKFSVVVKRKIFAYIHNSMSWQKIYKTHVIWTTVDSCLISNHHDHTSYPYFHNRFIVAKI